MSHVCYVPSGVSLGEKTRNAAMDLTQKTFSPGEFFELGELLLINISNSPDSVQEYEVWKRFSNSYYKFESITVSWMSTYQLELCLKEYQSPAFDMQTIVNRGFGVMGAMTADSWEVKKQKIKRCLDEY